MNNGNHNLMRVAFAVLAIAVIGAMMAGLFMQFSVPPPP